MKGKNIRHEFYQYLESLGVTVDDDVKRNIKDFLRKYARENNGVLVDELVKRENKLQRLKKHIRRQSGYERGKRQGDRLENKLYDGYSEDDIKREPSKYDIKDVI